VEFVVSAIVALRGWSDLHGCLRWKDNRPGQQRSAWSQRRTGPRRCAKRTMSRFPSTRAQRRAPVPARRQHSEVRQIWLTHSGGHLHARLPPPSSSAFTPAQALKPRPGDGPAHHIDLGHHDEQGFEIIEACQPLRTSPIPNPRDHPSPVHRALAGGVHRRLDFWRRSRSPTCASPFCSAWPTRSGWTAGLAAPSLTSTSPPQPARLCQPDLARFPCLRLAYEAAASGPAACIRAECRRRGRRRRIPRWRGPVSRHSAYNREGA